MFASFVFMKFEESGRSDALFNDGERTELGTEIASEVGQTEHRA